MTIIAGDRLSRNGRRRRFGRFFRCVETTGGQDFVAHGHKAVQELCLTKGLPAGVAHLAFRRSVHLAFRVFRCGRESGRDDRVELHQIRDVVDKTERLAAVKKTDRRRVPRGKNRRFDQPVETGGRR